MHHGRTRLSSAVLGLVLACATNAGAAGADVTQILAVKPSQAQIDCDTPPRDQWDKCKLEVRKTPTAGWILRDHRGLVVRQFIDSNGDNIVDQWSFFKNGQEVFRDIDANSNGKPDQQRWFFTAGSRWGLDANEDGTIDQWKAITADEATGEMVAALATGDFERFRRVMFDESDAARMKVGTEATERLTASYATAAQRFRALSQSLSPRVTWNRFEGNDPVGVPPSEAGGDGLVIYQNATTIAEVDGKTAWLRIPEVVKVGDVWKLSDVPDLINPDKPLQATGLIVKTADRLELGGDENQQATMIEEGEEIQQFAKMLQEHDQTLPADAADIRKLVAYHVKRAELCARVGSKSSKLKNREYWYKQTADSLNTAVQTGGYPQGIDALTQYATQFAKLQWGAELAAYFKYRAINADYAAKLSNENADHAKVQDAFLAQLKDYLKDYGTSDDAPDALIQLANGLEFAGQEEEAVSTYKRIVEQFPKSRVYAKATGSLRRLESVGRPIQLVGDALGGGGKVDCSKYAGKILVINYWATWCEPCKAEMGRLQKIRDKYGPQGVEIIGVTVDANPAAAEAYVRKNQFLWPQIHEEGSMESPPCVQYGVISLPYMILVDAQGRVMNRNVQFGHLESEVERALAEKVAAKDKASTK